MEDNYNEYFEVNKETWNKKVAIHSESEFYNNKEFLKGKCSLNDLELKEVGDVKGKSLLHLQCHFGQDTLSWERLGANCTGIDISIEGVKKARELNKLLNLKATFIESNLYDVPQNVEGQFDIVFTSYGVVGWLPELKTWGEIIAAKLKPGGIFYMAEFHPIIWMFDYLQEPAKMIYPYLNDGAVYEEYEGTYADDGKKGMVSKEYGWNHGLGEVISALSNAGLKIEFLHEFNESPYDCLPNMEVNKNGMYEFKKDKGMFPLVYSIKATKK
ncbi:Methyltransferase domain-containing protein [Lutibacter oricola]|uniref:Methyltransferase domain-containing protein n=1 Tax=Lutibacter oricola TaxID=762486 RepID=A0A1H3C222_9FLAO|nr:class I SAM-dependent methyltransferase [Lutibacter oricola]SDX47559.1 Methyltransferase domain-containing protein [Lutibacter oricola]